MRIQIVAMAISLVVNVNIFSKTNFPKKVTGFNVYTSEFVNYHSSDIQGVVGAGLSINFSHFSILDLMRDGNSFNNPYHFSVITKDFSLESGSVFMGGIFSANSLLLIDSHYEKEHPLISSNIEIVNRGRARFGRSQIKSFPNFLKYEKDIINIHSKYEKNLAIATTPTIFKSGNLKNYYNIKAKNSNGTLKNFFRLENIDRNIVIDASNDPREYFIIFVTSHGTTYISEIDFKLINGASQDKILFIYTNAKKLIMTHSGASSLTGRDLRVGIPGSILAGTTDIEFNEGLLTGGIYSRSLSGGREMSTVINGGQINFGRFVCFEYKNCKDPNDNPYN